MRRGLVEHDDGGPLEEHPGDGEALLLASRQAVAPLPDQRLVAVGQRHDDVVDARGPARLEDLGAGRVRSRIAQVGAYRVVEQMGVLAHHADGVGDRLQRHVPNIPAVDAHRPRGHVVEPGDEGGERRLARPARAHEGHDLTGLGHERHAAQDRLRRLGGQAAGRPAARLERGHGDLGGRRIPEPHVVDLDAPQDRAAGVERLCPRLVPDRPWRVEDLEDPVERHQGGEQIDPGRGEVGEGRVQARHVGGQRRERADLDRALDHGVAAEPVHRGGAQRAAQREGGVVDAAHDGMLHARVAHPGRQVRERPRFGGRAAEQLDQQGPRYAEALRHRRGQIGIDRHAAPGQRGQAVGEVSVEEHEAGDHDQRQQRHLPRQGQHGGEREHEREEIRRRARRRADGLLRSEDVVRQPGHERAGLRPREEGDRHPLDVVVERDAEVVDQAFADRGAQPPVHQVEAGDDHGHHHRDDEEPVDEAGIPMAGGQGIVDQCLEEQGREGADQGGEGERPEVGDQTASVGARESPGPPERGPVHLGVLQLLRVESCEFRHVGVGQRLPGESISP